MIPGLALGCHQLFQLHLSLCPLIHSLGEGLLAGGIVRIERGVSGTLRCG